MCTFGLSGSKREHFRVPAFNHEKTPRETQKERKSGGRGQKKTRNCGLPTLPGLTLPGLTIRGPTVRGPTVRGPTVRGHTVRAPTTPPFGAPPFRAHTLLFCFFLKKKAKRLKHQILTKVGQLRLAKVGQFFFWPTSVWPKVGISRWNPSHALPTSSSNSFVPRQQTLTLFIHLLQTSHGTNDELDVLHVGSFLEATCPPPIPS